MLPFETASSEGQQDRHHAECSFIPENTELKNLYVFNSFQLTLEMEVNREIVLNVPCMIKT